MTATTTHKTPKRLIYLDVARGIGVLFMLIGHTVPYDSIPYHIIYSFHMPLFFLISGFLFTIPNKTKLIQRSKRLLIPYLVFAIIFFAIDGFRLEKLRAIFWDNSNNLPIESGLWFLTAIAITQLTYSGITKLIRIPIAQFITAFTISIIACVFTNLNGNILPFSAQAGLASMLYFATGHMIKQLGLIDKIKPIAAIVTISISATIAFFLPLYNIRAGLHALIPVNQIVATLISISIIALAKDAANFIKDITVHFGRNSLLYLCINHFCIQTAKQIVKTDITDNMYINWILVFILSLILTRILVIAINMIPRKHIKPRLSASPIDELSKYVIDIKQHGKETG